MQLLMGWGAILCWKAARWKDGFSGYLRDQLEQY